MDGQPFLAQRRRKESKLPFPGIKYLPFSQWQVTLLTEILQLI
jgi:hypothetical protein